MTMNKMNKVLAGVGGALAIVGLVALIACLGLTMTAICAEKDPGKDFLALTTLLLSWKVILGCVAVAGGAAYKEQIRKTLDREYTYRKDTAQQGH
jgi:hypothetical protein